MTVDLLQNISLVSYILAAVLFIIAAALFFLLKVPKLVGELTGITAKRAIEAIKERSENGENVYKSSAFKSAGRSITEKIPSAGGFEGSALMYKGKLVVTEKLSTEELMPKSSETAVLHSGQNETTVLANGYDETTVLTNGQNETEVLAEGNTAAHSAINNNDDFYIEVEIGFTESSEIIE